MLVQLNAAQTALYKEQEDANYHTENLVLLAAVSGDFDLLDAALRLYHFHQKNGGINEHLTEMRDRLNEQLKPEFYPKTAKEIAATIKATRARLANLREKGLIK